MKTTVQLRGGLGNQLFQYATALEISLTYNTELLIDESLLPNFDTNRNGVTLRSNQINSFLHSGTIRNCRDKSLANKLKLRAYGIERKLGETKFQLVQELAGIYAREESNDDFVITPKRNFRINAPCINQVFFPNVRDRISSEMNSIVSETVWFSNKSELASREKPIGVHLRLGDYQNLKKVYGEPSINYYVNAIRLITERQNGNQRPIWLYSDSPQDAVEFFSHHIKFDEVMVSPENSRPIESLILLSKSSSIVAANSTFSWWAAYLAKLDALKIFPRPLFGAKGPAEPKNFLLEDWIQIGRKI